MISQDSDLLGLWLKQRRAAHHAGINLGLDRIRAVRDSMGFSLNCATIIVGGTNGKGSVVAIIESILRKSGLRVGAYTSPHLNRFNERVRVCGNDVTDSEILHSLELVEKSRNKVVLTYFEYATLAAARFFSISNLDVAILEVGLGGRLDAVNIFDGDCSVITSLAIDHADILGGSVEAIASEKAGIFRKDRPAVCGVNHPPFNLLRIANKLGADLVQIEKDFGYTSRSKNTWDFWSRRGAGLTSLPRPSLIGDVQLANSATALAVIDSLKDKIPTETDAVKKGLRDIDLRGRFQVVPGKPQIVFDVCHNPQATETFRSNLSNLPKTRRTVAMFGMLASKDAVGVVAIIKAHIDFWVITELDTEKTLVLSSLRAALVKNNVGRDFIRESDSVDHAFKIARQLVSDDDRILVIGSFYLVSDVMNIMRLK